MPENDNFIKFIDNDRTIQSRESLNNYESEKKDGSVYLRRHNLAENLTVTSDLRNKRNIKSIHITNFLRERERERCIIRAYNCGSSVVAAGLDAENNQRVVFGSRTARIERTRRRRRGEGGGSSEEGLEGKR